jgi:hypothetical protein
MMFCSLLNTPGYDSIGAYASWVVQQQLDDIISSLDPKNKICQQLVILNEDFKKITSTLKSNSIPVEDKDYDTD